MQWSSDGLPYCSKCGNQVSPADTFCSQCGASIEATSPTRIESSPSNEEEYSPEFRRSIEGKPEDWERKEFEVLRKWMIKEEKERIKFYREKIALKAKINEIIKIRYEYPEQKGKFEVELGEQKNKLRRKIIDEKQRRNNAEQERKYIIGARRKYNDQEKKTLSKLEQEWISEERRLTETWGKLQTTGERIEEGREILLGTLLCFGTCCYWSIASLVLICCCCNCCSFCGICCSPTTAAASGWVDNIANGLLIIIDK